MSGAFGKRYVDRFEVTRRWERIRDQTSYEPKESITGPLPKSLEDQIFATIVENGLWLQRAIADRWKVADQIADALSSRADLDSLPAADRPYTIPYLDPSRAYLDMSRERIAAAYMLWPYHSARYYGYLTTETAARLKSRTALCQIQGILYNNIRGVMDVLRLWFRSESDNETLKYFPRPKEDEKPEQATQGETNREDRKEPPSPDRKLWRPLELIEHVPDLCGVDHLVVHLKKLINARPVIRTAIETIQQLSVVKEEDLDSTTLAKLVIAAFKAVQIAQMTVFYHPNPADVKDKDDILLYELVHETSDMDSFPAKLIPFGDEDDEDNERLARNFRKLASTIYSVENKKLFPNFFAHRSSTLSSLRDTTKFISDGQITNYFLSTRPPVLVAPEAGANGGGGEPQSLWPLWYRQALSEFDFEKELPDWSNHFWWSPIDRDELQKKLFPGPDDGSVHKNDHMSAYWDQFALDRKVFIDKIDIPAEHPTGEPTFGYLMELLLRREPQSRTSFFFALAQTYQKQGRLCQFVGGTFLGLEVPGVPFSKERFDAIAGRVRGLVMAVAHYTTTHANKAVRWRAAQERSEFGRRVSLIIRLLKGDQKDREFARDHHLLFASPVGNLEDGQTDHDYKPNQGLGWKPSRYQIKNVFTTANDLHVLPRTSPPPPIECSGTWKALFYLGGTADKHNQLSRFIKHWPNYRGDRQSGLADRAITCKDCFRAALEFLLGEDMYDALRDRITISDQSIKLPSRPGIRFLIALCRFIVDVQSQASSSENTRITTIEFSPGCISIEFDKPKLLQVVWEKKKTGAPNFVHTTGIFMLLEDCQAIGFKKDQWGQFLNNAEFASPLTIEADNDWKRMLIKWQV
jgi:hypothetical protein